MAFKDYDKSASKIKSKTANLYANLIPCYDMRFKTSEFTSNLSKLQSKLEKHKVLRLNLFTDNNKDDSYHKHEVGEIVKRLKAEYIVFVEKNANLKARIKVCHEKAVDRSKFFSVSGVAMGFSLSMVKLGIFSKSDAKRITGYCMEYFKDFDRK